MTAPARVAEVAAEPSPSEQMLGLITGYWVSQAVGVAARLGVADELVGGPRTSDELAKSTGTHPGALYRLLRACASIGMFREVEGRRFAITPLGETLRSAAPGSLRDFAIAETAPGHWVPWGHLDDAVRTGRRVTLQHLGAELFEWYAKQPEEGAAFAGAMSNLSALVASEVARSVDFSTAKRVVDVGGAHGTVVATLLIRFPWLQGVLLDLPHVAPGARNALEAQGLAARCEVVAGDFFTAVPSGGDVYLLKQILHDWDDTQCTAILRACARSMAPGGRLLIMEMVIPDDGAPGPAQLMDINMLVLLPGKERTRAEYAELLSGVGLTLERHIPNHSPFDVLVARH